MEWARHVSKSFLHGSESLDYSPGVDTTFEKYLCECVHVCEYGQVPWYMHGGQGISSVGPHLPSCLRQGLLLASWLPESLVSACHILASMLR